MKVSDKIDELNYRIKKALNKESLDKKQIKVNENYSSIKMALNSMLELLSGCIAGGIIGYLIDNLVKTDFIFFAIFSFLGFVVGIINLNKYLKRF